MINLSHKSVLLKCREMHRFIQNVLHVWVRVGGLTSVLLNPCYGPVHDLLMLTIMLFVRNKLPL